MPISGIVITCQPEYSATIADTLGNSANIEVHAVLPAGKVVAVIEASTVDEEVALVEQLMTVAGVIDVQLAYHHFEDFPITGETCCQHSH